MNLPNSIKVETATSSFCIAFLTFEPCGQVRLKATLATNSLTHPNLTPNCWLSSCILGNLGAMF